MIIIKSQTFQIIWKWAEKEENNNEEKTHYYYYYYYIIIHYYMMKKRKRKKNAQKLIGQKSVFGVFLCNKNLKYEIIKNSLFS